MRSRSSRRRRLRRAPSPDAPLDTEALKGERVTVYETNDEGWAWGQLAADGYVGWLPANALAPPGAGADPQGRGAAHARVSRARRSSCRRSRRCRSARGSRSRAAKSASRSRASGGYRAGARIWRRSTTHETRFRRGRRALSRHALSVGRQDRARPRLLGPGAGRAAPPRHRLPARQRHAGSGARHSRRRSPTCARGDLVFWKGHVAIARDARHAASTPMRFTWRSRSSRWPKRSRASGGRQRSHQREAAVASAHDLAAGAHRGDQLLQRLEPGMAEDGDAADRRRPASPRVRPRRRPWHSRAAH